MAALAAVLLSGSSAIAQSKSATQPAVSPPSAYENQPIKRSNPAAAQGAPSKPADNFDWQRLVMAMAIVIGLILVLKYVAGRMFPGMKVGRATRVVRVLSRSPISPRQTVMLIQVGKRVIVVGDSSGDLSALAQIDDADEVASIVGQIDSAEIATAPRNRFNSLFGKAQKEFDSDEVMPDEVASGIGEADPSQGSDDIQSAQTEISGLIDRMRSLTRTLRRDGPQS